MGGLGVGGLGVGGLGVGGLDVGGLGVGGLGVEGLQKTFTPPTALSGSHPSGWALLVGARTIPPRAPPSRTSHR